MVSLSASSSVGTSGSASQVAALAKLRQSVRATGAGCSDCGSETASLSRPSDSVELSADATSFASTGVRQDKVAQARDKIAAGTYDNLSDKILDKVATGLLRDIGLES